MTASRSEVKREAQRIVLAATDAAKRSLSEGQFRDWSDEFRDEVVVEIDRQLRRCEKLFGLPMRQAPPPPFGHKAELGGSAEAEPETEDELERKMRNSE
jgi:hypothetical protein